MAACVQWTSVFIKHHVHAEIALATIVEAIADKRCESFSHHDGVPADLYLPMCTTGGNAAAGARTGIQDLMMEASHSNHHDCLAFHPVHVTDATASRVGAMLRTQATRHCGSKALGCTVNHVLTDDGFLWRTQP